MIKFPPMPTLFVVWVATFVGFIALTTGKDVAVGEFFFCVFLATVITGMAWLGFLKQKTQTNPG